MLDILRGGKVVHSNEESVKEDKIHLSGAEIPKAALPGSLFATECPVTSPEQSRLKRIRKNHLAAFSFSLNIHHSHARYSHVPWRMR